MTTQLIAINWAKAVTIALICLLILLFGINGQRQILYACMHISYCLWWLIEQKIYPDRRQQIFTEKVERRRLYSSTSHCWSFLYLTSIFSLHQSNRPFTNNYSDCNSSFLLRQLN